MINCAIDVETTGLDPNFHNMIELGIVPYDDKFRPLKGIKFLSRIKLVNDYAIDPKALEINKITLSELEKAPTSSQVRSMFLEWKYQIFGDEKLLPLGHNYAGFDKLFIQRWLGDFYGKIFDYHSKDSWQVADICQQIGLIDDDEDLRLETLRDYLKIDIPQLHSAYFDALCSLEVYKKCITMLRKLLN